MKRLIAILVVMVLVAGCAVQQASPTEPTQIPTESTTEPTEPQGEPLYLAGSLLEQQTAGAVKAFKLDKPCDGMVPMGGDLWLFFKDGSRTQIVVYSGTELRQSNEITLALEVLPGNRGVTVSASGLSYFDAQNQQIVLLDGMIQEKNRIDLPDNAKGIPVVTPDQSKAYFYTDDELRVLDLQTGIASLLRQENAAWQSIYGLAFDGKVLLCDMIDAEQNGYTAYYDTRNGKLLGKDTNGWIFSTCDDLFLLQKADDANAQILFGTWDRPLMTFSPVGEDSRIWPVLEMGGVIGVRNGAEGLTLDFYGLESGLRSAAVEFKQGNEISMLTADRDNHCIWFVLYDQEKNQNTLCRWDYEQSPVEDDTVYSAPRYTQDNPDMDGLRRCASWAKRLGSTNAMEIRIWTDAVAEPWKEMNEEYRVDQFQAALTVLEYELSGFPEGMVAKLGTLSKNQKITVSLVRGSEHDAQGYYQWQDGSIYIALEMGSNMESAFYNALYRAMDTYILNANSILDEWDSDTPVSDRAMIFAYAMSENQDAFFEQRSAQNKLKQLCKAIRDAFGLKKWEEALPWEQYLSN